MGLQISESVGPGHPDKIADNISDSLLELTLKHDIKAQFACETLISNKLVVVAGEVTTSNLDFSSKMEDLFKIKIKEILKSLEYDPEFFKILIDVKSQSQDIRLGSGLIGDSEILTGDQSIVFGYATNQTKSYLPISFAVATDLIREVVDRKKLKEIEGINLDMKSLVIMNGLTEVKDLVLSIQHSEYVDISKFKEAIYKFVVLPVINKYGLSITKDKVFINTGGAFISGGLDADTGATNRKLMVDSYGPSIRHGGGGYSGKDLTKVDRLGAYYARWICKNLVAAGVCDEIELELSYRFGSKHAFFYSFKNLKHSQYKEEEIVKLVKDIFPLKFEEIYKLFNKKQISYSLLACYGHFGREDGVFPWENLDKVTEIKKYLGISN